MGDDLIGRATRALGPRVEIVGALAGSRSASSVYEARLVGSDGRAVVKVTPAGDGQQTARRELSFYQNLAAQVPVGTPQLLEYLDDEELTVIVLSAHPSAPPAKSWDNAAWLTIAAELAALHSTSVADLLPWNDWPWLQQVLVDPPTSVAQDYWGKTAAARQMPSILRETRAMAAALQGIPGTFIHGDCHVDNLLLEAGEFIWTDWQAPGVGSPAIDLAFLWMRAGLDGAELPYDEMMAEYAKGRSVEQGVFRPSLIAAELAFFLFGFPMFAGFRTGSEREWATVRVLGLMDDWLDQQ